MIPELSLIYLDLSSTEVNFAVNEAKPRWSSVRPDRILWNKVLGWAHFWFNLRTSGIAHMMNCGWAEGMKIGWKS